MLFDSQFLTKLEDALAKMAEQCFKLIKGLSIFRKQTSLARHVVETP